MNDIEKDLFRKTVVIKTTSLKPAEYSVLSEDKSIRADETFPILPTAFLALKRF